MARHTCPHWIGYLLLNPLRRLWENPDKLLGPFVKDGMIVLEPGPAMGYFTLPLARMVGPNGRVVAVDINPKMLSVLKHRAQKRGLAERIELRQAGQAGLGIGDLQGKVDFVVAIHVVHEVPDKRAFFLSIFLAMKPGGKILFLEPKGHVSIEKFRRSLGLAEEIGLRSEALPAKENRRWALLAKPR